MSFSYDKLTPVLVLDPITDVVNKRDYSILQGGTNISYKPYTSTAISTSSIQFSCPPPSPNILVDRKISFCLPVRLTLTGLITTNNLAYVPPTSLLNPGLDCLRAYPISSNIDTLSATINDMSVNINMADVIHALSHFNVDARLREHDYSLSPNYPDQSGNYSDLNGSIRSPMAFYGDGLHNACSQRGSFPFVIVSNPTVIPSIAGTPATAVVDVLLTEPLFLSPFYFGCNDSQGFFNVNTMDFNITFLNQASRFWSHDALTPVSTSIAPVASVFSSISSVNSQFNGFANPAFSYATNQPFMLFKYITPNLLMKGLGPQIPITYPFFDILRFPTDISTVPHVPGAQPGGGSQYSSNNIILNTIPRRVYIYARPSNSVLYSRSDLTDTYLSISNVQIQWANNNTLLTSADQRQLYLTAVKNHCDLSWEQWSGFPVNNPSFNPSTASVPYSTVGSIVCLEFGTDIQLNSDECPGLRDTQYMFQVNVTLQNLNQSGAWDNIPMTLYVVPVLEGAFVIPQVGRAIAQLGVISKSDVINARQAPLVDYNTIQDINGGNFLSGLKEFGTKLNNFLKDSKIISTVGSLIPHPGVQAVSTIARNLGYGEGVMAGTKHHKAKRSLKYR